MYTCVYLSVPVYIGVSVYRIKERMLDPMEFEMPDMCFGI